MPEIADRDEPVSKMVENEVSQRLTESVVPGLGGGPVLSPEMLWYVCSEGHRFPVDPSTVEFDLDGPPPRDCPKCGKPAHEENCRPSS